MYLSFYQLEHKPFQISTDPRFLWLGEKHEEALATLRYGILDNKGFLLLTGDVGTGKTTLINALLRSLEQNILVATIRDPALEPDDFFNYTAHAFGMQGGFASKGSFLIQFEQFLLQARQKNKKVLLIIDEAQRIGQALLEEVRLLSNIEEEESKLLNIFFVGQIEFNEIILRPENRPIRQRITVNYNIPPLTRRETGEYIAHRLKIAGSTAKIFKEDAVDEIFSFSKGYPRLINIICDRSLLTGFVEESKNISGRHVRECAAELNIPHIQHKAPPVHDGNHKEPSKTSEAALISKPAAKSSKKEKATITKQAFSYTVLTIIVVVLLGLIYFSLSRNVTLPLLGAYTRGRIPESSQKITIIRDNVPSDHQDKTTDPHKTGQSDTPANHPVPKETAAGKTTVMDENALRGEKSVQKTAHPAAVQTDPNDQVNNTELFKETKIIIDDLITRSGPPESIPSEEAEAASADSEIQAGQGEIEEQKLTAEQDQHLQFLENFEKLIITFAANSNYPPVESLQELDLLVDAAASQSQYILLVTGFSDSRGNESYNVKLSEFRANSVKSYLMGKGLKQTQIKTQALGSQNPIAPNNTPSGRMANRRVEITVQDMNKF